MADNVRAFANANVTYFPYLELRPGSGKGLIETLASHSCTVVTDDFPCFFLPRMVATVTDRLKVRLEKVDSNGIFPMRGTDRVFLRAQDFRRFLQKNLRPHLLEFPKQNPMAELQIPRLDRIPRDILMKWPSADVVEIAKHPGTLTEFAIDHSVGITDVRGGSTSATTRLKHFCKGRILRYNKDRNKPEEDATSGFSPYLHFGNISAHEIFARLMESEEWTIGDLALKPNGSRNGWWGCSPMLEAFLDQLITWREIGFNMCSQRNDYDQYESLPDWAQQTLQKHAGDPRPYVYSLEEFENAQTHDDLWNAVQMQLVREGRIHNYLRMLWGKKILHWSESPQAALRIMIELNNKYALDGRDPNSYSGIFWTLGRYDRAWGPEREVFDKIRYMTCTNTARKVCVKNYMERFKPD